MKKKDFVSDLRNKTIKELVSMRKKFKLDLFNMKMKNVVKGLKEVHKIRNLRRNIARINTILSTKIN